MFKKPSDYMTEERNQLGILLKQARLLKILEVALQKHIDPELAPHCHICHLKSGKLHILVNGSHWLTRLRYHVPDLLSRLRTEAGFHQLTGIECRTHPGTVTVADPAHNEKILSPYAKHALSTLRNLTSDW